jgi:hypothetical protein
MKISELKKCPEWLKDAVTVDADVLIDEWGWVTWLGGVFSGGEFRGGVFSGGEFRGGVFSGGVFSGGEFRGGVFSGGVFSGGVFSGGVFSGGVFSGGVFSGGVFSGGEFRGGVFSGGDCYFGELIKVNIEPGLYAYGKRVDSELIPIVENLDAKILEAISHGGGRLRMSTWHSCETTHCRAGWAVHLAGQAGYELESATSAHMAGMAIYWKSTGRVPDFFCDDVTALSDIKRCADIDAKPAAV